MNLRLLVLEFNSTDRVASCFHKKSFELVLIKLESEESPSAGQFLIYDTEELEYDNGIIKIQRYLIENAKIDDCIEFNHDGTFKISSWLAFSSNCNHKTFERKVAYADWYGIVDCAGVPGISKQHDAFRSYIVVKDLNYKQNKTELFKVDFVKGKLQKTSQEYKKKYDGLMKRMNEFEEKIREKEEGAGTLVPQRPSRSVDEKKNENNNNHGMRKQKKSRSRSRSRTSKAGKVTYGPAPDIVQLLAATRITETPILLTQPPVDSRVLPPPHSVSESSLLRPITLRSSGVVIYKISESEFIVWLKEMKAFALLRTSKVGLVHLGSNYEFQYTPIQNDSCFTYEVINKEKKLESSLPFEIHQSGDVISAGFYVDLCSPNTKCHIWTFYTGIPFLNSPQVGVVTMADIVETPSGSKKKWQEALRSYIGNTNAQCMKCMCRLVKQNAPQKMFDPFLIDEFKSIQRYTWQVVKICGSKEFEDEKEEEMRRDNLREGLSQYEENDEIARIKRQNHQNVHFGTNAFRTFDTEGPSFSSFGSSHM